MKGSSSARAFHEVGTGSSVWCLGPSPPHAQALVHPGFVEN